MIVLVIGLVVPQPGCPTCKAPLPESARPGDFALCSRCGALNRYHGGSEWRAATEDETREYGPGILRQLSKLAQHCH